MNIYSVRMCIVIKVNSSERALYPYICLINVMERFGSLLFLTGRFKRLKSTSIIKKDKINTNCLYCN